MALGMKARDECGVQKPAVNLETMVDSPTCEDCRILLCSANAVSQRDASCRCSLRSVLEAHTHAQKLLMFAAFSIPVNIQLG